jgi:hypothetical protein
MRGEFNIPYFAPVRRAPLGEYGSREPAACIIEVSA